MIRAIDAGTVHRICSGQVVVDLAVAVKELVENSLDARASAPSTYVWRPTHTDIRLREHGSELVEIVDNGTGIDESNYEALGRKHHTSKLAAFEDLEKLASFGFRGEALSSLCAIANVTVTTRTATQAIGTKLVFDAAGRLTAREPAPREVGTTVTLRNLFEPLPVRRREFLRNIKRDYGRTLALIQAYALISAGVRITCSNQNGKSERQKVLGTEGGTASLRDNIVSVFGAKQAQQLLPVTVTVPGEDGDPDAAIHVTGFVSRADPGLGRPSGDRQFVYINGRPVDLPKVTKAVNEVYRTYNMHQTPFVVLNVKLHAAAFDVNVTPDKRTVFLHRERDLLAALRTYLETLFQPARSSYAVSTATASVLEDYAGFGSTPSDAPGSDDVGFSDPLAEARPRTPLASTSSSSPPPPAGSSSPLRSAVAVDRPAVPAPPASAVSRLRAPLEPASAAPAPKRLRPTELTGEAGLQRTRDRMVNLDFRRRRILPVVDSENEDEAEDSAVDIVQPKPTTATTGAPHRKGPPLRPAAEDADEEQHRRPHSTTARGPQEHREEHHHHGHGHRNDQATSPSRGDHAHRVAGAAIAPLVGDDDHDNHDDGDGEPNRGGRRPIAIDDDDGDGDSAGLTRGGAGSASAGRPGGGAGATAALVLVPSGVDTQAARPRPDLRHVCVPVAFDADAVAARLRAAARPPHGVDGDRDATDAGPSPFRAPLSDGPESEQELSRHITKDDFLRMQIIGQFNLGFIIVRLDHGAQSDLFMIDQHASDEKYNFETLQRTVRLNTQRLLSPKTLELSAADEAIVRSNLEVFRFNGFECDFDDAAPAGRRVRLVAVPYSRSTSFTSRDVEELVGLVADRPGELVRCSRVRAMFASYACRKSVMIGDALNREQMARVVSHMSEIDQPWNCPHGRPTMRHLVDLTHLERQQRPRATVPDASSSTA